MLHKFAFIIILLLILLGAFALFNGCHKRIGHCSHYRSHESKLKWLIKKISKDLKLNNEQKEELNRIKDEILAKKAEFKTGHKEIADQILIQVKSESVDQQALNQLFENKELEFKEMRAFLIEKFTEFHSILTPVQREKLAAKMEKFHNKHK